MARTVWKGAISFGLIHIPVGLYPASQPNEIDLDLLDKRDFAPVGYQRYNKVTGKKIDMDDVVKGYEYEPGEYVVLTEEDIRRANVEATRTIDIVCFVDREVIAPTFFETPYYLGVEAGGDKVYTLLREALEKAGKAALARVVLRTKQHLCLIVPVADVLVLNLLRWHDEIRDAAEHAPSPKVRLNAKEVDMAVRLVEEMTEDWRPSTYKDEFHDDLLKRIADKVSKDETHTITEAEPEEAGTEAGKGELIDLVALLQKSLKSGAAPTKRSAPRTRAASAAKGA